MHILLKTPPEGEKGKKGKKIEPDNAESTGRKRTLTFFAREGGKEGFRSERTCSSSSPSVERAIWKS